MTVYDPKKFDWHAAALKHIAGGGTARDAGYPKIFNDTPMTGTYAYRPSKNDAPKAVFYWYSAKTEGLLLCRINGENVKYGLDIWRACATHPIERAIYDTVAQTGRWPAEIVIDFGDGRTDSSMTRGTIAIGDNSGIDPATQWRGDIGEWCDRAKKILKAGAPETQAEADAVADVKTKLADLVNEADKKREEITGPLYRKYKSANEEWSSFINPAKQLLPSLGTLINTFMRAEQKRRQEEANKINAEAAAKAAADVAAKGPADPTTNPLGVGHAPTVEPVRVQVGTRKTVKEAKKRIVVFDDFQKAAAYLCAMKEVPPDVKKVITDRVMALLSAGAEVPGAKLDMETVGR